MAQKARVSQRLLDPHGAAEYMRAYRREYEKKNRKRITENRKARIARMTDEQRAAFNARRRELRRLSRQRMPARQSSELMYEYRKCGKLHPEFNAAMSSEIYKAARRVAKCTGIKWAVDHIIPVARGGFHHQANFQIMPRHINTAKCADPIWDSDTYMTYRDVPRRLWPAALAPAYEAMIKARSKAA